MIIHMHQYWIHQPDLQSTFYKSKNSNADLGYRIYYFN